MKKEKVNGQIILKISIFWILVLAMIVSLLIAFFKNYVFASDNNIDIDNDNS